MNRIAVAARVSCVVLAALSAPIAAAAGPWVLDNASSRISFVSIKADHIAEVHRFDSLSGIVTPAGSISVAIELASVATLIPIRDDRMRALLFETEAFPTARLSGQLALESLEALPIGGTSAQTVEIVLTIRDQALPVTADLLVARLADDRIVAVTRQPVIVDAAQVDLAEGLEKLREIAGLPSISRAVPVSAVMVFERSQGD